MAHCDTPPPPPLRQSWQNRPSSQAPASLRECVKLHESDFSFLWIGAALMAGYVAVLNWRLGVSHHFPLLTTYLVLSLFTDLSRFVLIVRSGCASELYLYLYYYSDLRLAVAYLVVAELYRRTLPAQLWRLLGRCCSAILGLLALVSWAQIWQSDLQRTMLFAYRLADKLHFVSLGLILFLWATIYLRDLPRGIAANMVQVWGITFCSLSRLTQRSTFSFLGLPQRLAFNSRYLSWHKSGFLLASALPWYRVGRSICR
jgi:hypothetical protein